MFSSFFSPAAFVVACASGLETFNYKFIVVVRIIKDVLDAAELRSRTETLHLKKANELVLGK